MTNLDELNDRIRALTNNAVYIDQDEGSPVDGITSWACFGVNAESDWTFNIGRLNDGSVVAAEGYGPHDLLRHPRLVMDVFTKAKMSYFLTEAEGFHEECLTWTCDNFGETVCPEHVTHGFDEAWDLMEKHILSQYVTV